ncbi:MAG: prepilin-type N-terminal cleavage/methylation domain-containing protein [Gammaproteobacteria bacterium]
MVKQIKAPRYLQRGVSLIEVLISLFILSFLLLSLDAVQLLSFKNTQAVYSFNIALQRVDILLTHQDRDSYLAEWQEENKEYLPQAESLVLSDKVILIWGGMQGGCEHSVMEKAGCLNVSI